jgi:hypothetical protein
VVRREQREVVRVDGRVVFKQKPDGFSERAIRIAAEQIGVSFAHRGHLLHSASLRRYLKSRNPTGNPPCFDARERKLNGVLLTLFCARFD